MRKVTQPFHSVTFWMLVGVTAAAALLRFHALGVPSLWIDEGFSVVAARGILEHGRPLLPGGETSWNYLPAHYLMSFGLVLFRDLEFGARFFPALAGTLLIPAFYLLNRLVFRSRVQAVTAMVLLAFLAYEVGWSRQARGYVVLQLFMVLAVASFYRFLDRPNAKGLWMTLACTCLSVLSHRAGYLVPLILVLAAACAWRDAWQGLRWAWAHKGHLAGAAAAGLAFGALMIGLNTNSSLAGALENVAGQAQRHYLARYATFAFAQFKGLLVWTLLGAVLAAWKHPARSVPLLVAAAAYLYVIAFRNVLIHYRYMLPVLFLFPLFAAYGFSFLLEQCRTLPRRSRYAAVAVLVLAMSGSIVTARMMIRPRVHHYLGFTSPLPDWEKAYRWVRTDARSTPGGSGAGPVTISTFPMFHDLYLGADVGTKYFLPFSISGFPGDERMTPRYSRARVVGSAAELVAANGYVVIDDFSLRMLVDQETQHLLLTRPPDQIIDGPRNFDVFIWRPVRAE